MWAGWEDSHSKGEVMEDEVIERFMQIVLDLSSGVLAQQHRIESLEHRIKQLEDAVIVNAVSNLHYQRDIIE